MKMRSLVTLFIFLAVSGCREVLFEQVTPAAPAGSTGPMIDTPPLPSAAVVEASKVSTRLQVRMHRQQSQRVLELMRANELRGHAVLSNTLVGSFVYEVLEGEEVLATESFADPTVAHAAFEPGGHGAHAHQVRPFGEFIVKIPGRARAALGWSLNVYRFTEDVGEDYIDVESLKRYKKQGSLTVVAQLSSRQLSQTFDTLDSTDRAVLPR